MENHERAKFIEYVLATTTDPTIRNLYEGLRNETHYRITEAQRFHDPMQGWQVATIREDILQISRTHAADLLGITRQTINSWENSRTYARDVHARLLWLIAIHPFLEQKWPDPHQRPTIRQLLENAKAFDPEPSPLDRLVQRGKLA